MTSTALAIETRDLSKRFRRHLDRRQSLKERIVRGRPKATEDFWALRDLSLQVPKGSVYGVIGHNGSGKSTLLKIISGIYRPSEGDISVHGRVAFPGCPTDPPRRGMCRSNQEPKKGISSSRNDW